MITKEGHLTMRNFCVSPPRMRQHAQRQQAASWEAEM